MAEVNAAFEAILAAVRAAPGVAAASVVRSLPFAGGASVTDLRLTPEAERALVDYQVVQSGFFQTLGIPLLRGRDFSSAAAAEAPPVAIVNQAFARRFFPEADPVGRTLYGGVDRRVVGVVGDIRRRGLREEARPEMYTAYGQIPNARGTRRLLVAMEPQRGASIDAVRAAIMAADRGAAISEGQSMADVIAASTAEERGMLRLLTTAAMLALALGAVGLYGVMAVGVGTRIREFGLRMALGANRAAVVRLVLHQGVTLVALGLVLGGLASLAAGRALGGLLYGVSSVDPLALGMAVAVLGVAAAAALSIPALRATRADPAVMLRSE